jgi:hypothetical protein
VDLDRERLVNSEQGRRIWLREGRRQLDELRRRRARPIARSRTERLRESKRGLEEVRPPPLPPRPDTIELRALMGRYGAGANTGRLATTHALHRRRAHASEHAVAGRARRKVRDPGHRAVRRCQAPGVLGKPRWRVRSRGQGACARARRGARPARRGPARRPAPPAATRRHQGRSAPTCGLRAAVRWSRRRPPAHGRATAAFVCARTRLYPHVARAYSGRPPRATIDLALTLASP